MTRLVTQSRVVPSCRKEVYGSYQAVGRRLTCLRERFRVLPAANASPTPRLLRETEVGWQPADRKRRFLGRECVLDLLDVSCCDGSPAGSDCSSIHHVLQLTHIPRKRILLKRNDGILRQTRCSRAIPSSKTGKEVFSQRKYVGASRPQRWELNRESLEPVVEV